MNADRDAWTTYAERHGLLRDAVTSPVIPNKYHAIPVHVDGVRFASKKEAARFLELQLLAEAGLLADLECQPVFTSAHHGNLAIPGADRDYDRVGSIQRTSGI